MSNNRRYLHLSDGCEKCPVQNCTTGTYRGSDCSALRDKAGISFDPLTIGEHLCHGQTEELCELLYDVSLGKRPWCKIPPAQCEETAEEELRDCIHCIQDWLMTPAEQMEREYN